ncbi:MAG: hypothetical protein ABFC94_18705 [Syntrophomonas sp.]
MRKYLIIFILSFLILASPWGYSSYCIAAQQPYSTSESISQVLIKYSGYELSNTSQLLLQPFVEDGIVFGAFEDFIYAYGGNISRESNIWIGTIGEGIGAKRISINLNDETATIEYQQPQNWVVLTTQKITPLQESAEGYLVLPLSNVVKLTGGATAWDNNLKTLKVSLVCIPEIYGDSTSKSYQNWWFQLGATTPDRVNPLPNDFNTHKPDEKISPHTLQFYKEMARKTADVYDGVGFHTAVDMMKHYLDGSGKSFEIDFGKLNRDCNQDKDNFVSPINKRTRDINNAISAAELLCMEENKSIQFVSNDINDGCIEAWNSQDWFGSIHGYSTYTQCSLRRQGNQYSMTMNYYLRDIYDWDKNKSVPSALFFRRLSEHSMWLLNAYGYARDFEVNGCEKLTIRWTKGQRINTGAQVLQFSESKPL